MSNSDLDTQWSEFLHVGLGEASGCARGDLVEESLAHPGPRARSRRSKLSLAEVEGWDRSEASPREKASGMFGDRRVADLSTRDTNSVRRMRTDPT